MSDWTFVWDWLPHARSFLDSSFASSVIGALAGAFFGAFAATRFAERQERERAKRHDLRNNNSGVVLSASIANHCLTFKKQLVKNLVETFEKDREDYAVSLEAARNGGKQGQIDVRYDFRGLTFFRHEADELRTLLVNEVSADPKVTMAGIQLWQSLHSLEKSVDQRSEEMRRLIGLKGRISNDEHAHLYFGLPTGEGIDERYSDTIYAIRDLLDSAIFFSTLIAERLSERGQKISKTLGKNTDKPIKWDFKSIEDA